MFTQDFLSQIEKAVFQPYFIEGIHAFFEDDIAAGKFKTEHDEYQEALAILLPSFSSEEHKTFQNYEAVCETIRTHYAQHEFLAGIYAGFKQIFTPDNAMDAGFHKYVTGEIGTQPNIQRYTEIYAAKNERNRLYALLAEGRVENCDSPIVCVSCYWDQAATSAGASAFYCGYRTASALTDRFGLMETDYMNRVVKLLAFEHSFGYIETFAEKERRIQREQSGSSDSADINSEG